jgi:hypothetical protein
MGVNPTRQNARAGGSPNGHGGNEMADAFDVTGHQIIPKTTRGLPCKRGPSLGPPLHGGFSKPPMLLASVLMKDLNP